MASWTDTLKKVAGVALGVAAPTLGTALGTPLAGAAMSKVSEVLLGKPDGSEAELTHAMNNMTPAQVVELRTADQAFELDLKEKGIKLEELHVKDRERASGMFKVDQTPQKVISYVYISGYFLMFVSLITVVLMGILPKEPDPVLMIFLGMISTLIGVLTTAVPQILTFWFGSSSGSKDKTGGMLQTLMDKIQK